MLSVVDVVDRPAFVVSAVRCRSDHRDWTSPEERDDHRIVLVRSGRFRRWVDGVDVDLDPTVGYFGVPKQEERFAHPAGGDVCTSVRVAPELWADAAGEPGRRPACSALYVDAALDLAHRRCLSAAEDGDVDYALAEQVLTLIRHAVDRMPARSRPVESAPDDRRLVAAAREAITTGDAASGALFSLAESIGVSPFRLSRVFSREMGVSITRYRNRVRLGSVLDRLEAGEVGLAVLAVDLGFADQAHLSRTVRKELGYTPTALRRLLAPAAPGELFTR
ncbi:helix-turn-helix transcriptional regulator [Embleya sp. NBC_00888]|uniref:helix-turn-helix transcriptional regulator n=1 Tax=Embleya sp. NBC_00888 TaxID=2975960 RepID=UPI003868A8CE|nr:helix-turn-helix transcriptional regulator [Embleya sp. NBC_00888]